VGKQGIFTFIALLVAVSLAAIWLRRREYVPAPVIESSAPQVPEAKPPQEVTADREPAASAPFESKKTTDPEFQKWLSSEAKELDRIHVDGDAKRAQIRSVVRKMTPQQSRQLLQTAKNPRSPAAEKILSTYLLVEGGLRTESELTELIAAPLEEPGNYAPHSEEEVKGIREKSLRIMAIDGLFSRAQSEPTAKAALARAASQATDPSVRAYAEDKLRQLQ
jgi:hypothetical protein